MIKLTIPGEVVGKMRPRATARNGFARVYTPKETINYESYVKALFAQKYPGFVPMDGPIQMNLLIVRGIPTSVSKKKKDMMMFNEIKVTVKPDIDNVIKTICDALNGLAYIDDKLIAKLCAEKQYGEIPRAEVEINNY